jgi:methylated-DNA-protein-cysteine methyltransferase-like protein
MARARTRAGFNHRICEDAACCVSTGIGMKTNTNDGMFARMRATIRKIPRGKVATYGDVAYAAGFPGAARQVVWALHGSGDLLPWQRVVGAGGKILLTGVQAAEQRLLLQSEGIAFNGLRVDMKQHCYAWPMFRRIKRKSQRVQRTRGE